MNQANSTCHVHTWGSHVVPLVAALSAVPGPIVEWGSGLVSSPLILGLCGVDVEGVKGRRILTLEESTLWFEYARRLANANHEVRKVSDEEVVSSVQDWLGGEQAGVALVDGELPESAREDHYLPRVEFVRRLRGLVRVFVVHDTESPWFRENPEWVKLHESFKFKWIHHPPGSPWTSVLSDEIDVKDIQRFLR